LPGDRIRYFTAKEVSGQTERFSRFEKVPPIVAPRHHIVKLTPCSDGSVLELSGSHVCGL
jgi:hypothetical protein